MRKFNFGQMISLFANLGVIVSILILAIEVSQNTETQRLIAAQQVLGLSYSNNTALASSELPEIAAIIEAGGEVTPGQKNLFEQNLRAIFAALWQVYYQHEQGVLDAEIFDAYAWRACNVVKAPMVLEWWNEASPGFGRSFRDFVADCVTANSAE